MMMNLVKILFAALFCHCVVSESNCQELRRSVNGDSHPPGCPGAVTGNGAPARAYCLNSNGKMPWYKDCCVWQNNRCVPKPTPPPTNAPGCKKVRLEEKWCTKKIVDAFGDDELWIQPCVENYGDNKKTGWNKFPTKLQIQGAPAGIMLDYDTPSWDEREIAAKSCNVAETQLCQGIYRCEEAKPNIIDCSELRRSVNGDRFQPGCPGAVMGNGAPVRAYCQNDNGKMPWYQQCCKWEANKCVPKEVYKVDCKTIVKKKFCRDQDGCDWSNGVCRGEDHKVEAGTCAAIKGRKKCKKNKQCVYRFRRCTSVDLAGCGQYLKFKHCKKDETCHWEKNICKEGAGPAVKDCSQLKKAPKCAARADCEFADGKCRSSD